MVFPGVVNVDVVATPTQILPLKQIPYPFILNVVAPNPYQLIPFVEKDNVLPTPLVTT